ncbi:hypothetical protein SASPL_113207 [Salvia splendens]|uniref:Flavonol synthase n=1 Tax=Salvia splendens TaxID=180675 RepID=A0A8X8XYJ4_SALSN|nr:hypothetical protein SASPL_113207 [Salvia splendens]
MAAVAQNSSFVKALAENTTLKSIPSQFTFATDSKGSQSDSLPIIDFSLLTSPDPDQRCRVLADLDSACREWGFFILVNHGISETILKAIIEASLEFFELPEEEKRRYEAKSASDPSSPAAAASSTPPTKGETLQEFTGKTRPVFKKLMHAIGENLGHEQGFVDEALKLDSCFQLYAANYYPPCPEPDQAIGIPAHTDHGLLTFLIHKGVAGLQIQHNGEWFDTVSPQNAILIRHVTAIRKVGLD